MSALRIVLLTPELLSIGGIQRYNRFLIRALDRHASETGGAVSILCLNDSRPRVLTGDLAGLTASRFSFFDGNRLHFSMRFASELRMADVVIYGLLGFTPLVVIQKSVNPTARSILLIYGADAWKKRSRYHSWSVKRVDRFLSISQYTLDRFSDAYRITHGQAGFVVPNPVSKEWLQTTPSGKERPEESSSQLLSVCRLADTEQPKGIDNVIRALPALLGQYPDLVHTVVGDGPDRSRLQMLAEELGVGASVRFCGFISENQLKEEFARCTLYVMPSAKEGFGFVFIEAMACGKPVVAARAGATSEVVEHGRTGLLVEYGDEQALAQAISCLLADSRLRQQMGSAGRDTVLARYRFDTFAQRVTAVLNSLAIGSP